MASPVRKLVLASVCFASHYIMRLCLNGLALGALKTLILTLFLDSLFLQKKFDILELNWWYLISYSRKLFKK